jgi:hypothetical protein
MFQMIKVGKVPRKGLSRSLINLELKSPCMMTLFQDRFRFNLVLWPTNLFPIGMEVAEKGEPDLNLLVRSHNPQS